VTLSLGLGYLLSGTKLTVLWLAIVDVSTTGERAGRYYMGLELFSHSAETQCTKFSQARPAIDAVRLVERAFPPAKPPLGAVFLIIHLFKHYRHPTKVLCTVIHSTMPMDGLFLQRLCVASGRDRVMERFALIRLSLFRYS
jgi:hypothetical protein